MPKLRRLLPPAAGIGLSSYGKWHAGHKKIPPLCMERRDSLSYGRQGYQLVLNELKADILLGSRSLLDEENIGNH